MTHVSAVLGQQQDRTEHLVVLGFDKQHEAGKYLVQRLVGCNHFQNAALSFSELIFLFASGYIAANDHATEGTATTGLERTTTDTCPQTMWSFRMLDDHFHVVDLFAADRTRERKLIGGKRGRSIRLKETVLFGPILGGRGSRTRTKHSLSCRIKNEELFIAVGDDDRFTQVVEN